MRALWLERAWPRRACGRRELLAREGRFFNSKTPSIFSGSLVYLMGCALGGSRYCMYLGR
jgi:hypothetical protein